MVLDAGSSGLERYISVSSSKAVPSWMRSARPGVLSPYRLDIRSFIRKPAQTQPIKCSRRCATVSIGCPAAYSGRNIRKPGCGPLSASPTSVVRAVSAALPESRACSIAARRTGSLNGS